MKCRNMDEDRCGRIGEGSMLCVGKIDGTYGRIRHV